MGSALSVDDKKWAGRIDWCNYLTSWQAI